MRRFVTVGVFSVAAVLYGACSDDGGDGPIGTGGSGGSGGSAGAGTGASGGQAGTGNIAGSAGQGGTGGTAGVGGSAGSAGSAGTAGSGGNDPDAGDGGVDSDGGLSGDAGGDASLPPPCTGCLELRAPLTAPGESAYFELDFSSRDLSDATATFRLGALVFDESGQTLITPFATSFDGNVTYGQGNGTSIVNNAATFTNTSTFIDVLLDIGAIASFDDTKVIAAGIQVFAGGSYAGPPPTLMLDSVTFTGTNAPANLDFTTDAQGFVRNNNVGIQTAEVIHH